MDVLNFCSLMKYIKGKYPQLRIGQILSNIVPLNESNLFYMRDDDLINKLKAYIQVLNLNQGRRKNV
jgi:hypothetical protein